MPNKKVPKKKVLDTYTISGTNVIVQDGDCVLLKPKKENEPLYVAQVEKIKQVKCGEVEIRVRWFFRPEDTILGRLDFHGAKEVFYSDSFGEVSAKSIEGTCTIHSLRNYNKLQTVEEEDYFYRFKYDESTGRFADCNVTVYCKCEMPANPDQFMIECDLCKEWYHPACINMTIEDAKKEAENFICYVCSKKVYFSWTDCSFGRAQRLTRPNSETFEPSFLFSLLLSRISLPLSFTIFPCPLPLPDIKTMVSSK